MLVNPKFVELNDFRRVHCAKGSDLFARVGKREPSAPLPSSKDIIPLNQSKLDMLEDLQAYDESLEIAHAEKIQEESRQKKLEELERLKREQSEP